ncbi:MAG: AmmeMemoRadiSam system protein B [Candidatus Hermodarchaeota archaeon]
MGIKKARLAGQWYPGTKDELLTKLDTCFTDNTFGPGEKPVSQNLDDRTIIGAVSPHAGINFSGECAAHTYLNLFKEKIPDTVIVIGFEHQSYVKPSILVEGEWQTPIGNLQIDSKLANEIVKISKTLESNDRVFINSSENSLELQMPFIKYCAGVNDVKIVPIKFRSHEYEIINNIAMDIANAIKSVDKDVVIVASSDMSHEQISTKKDLETLKSNDHRVIEQFLTLNAENVLNPEKIIPDDSFLNPYKTVTVCGTITMSTLILACKSLGANKGKLLKYYTSSEKTGSLGGYCVGYFSGIFIK